MNTQISTKAIQQKFWKVNITPKTVEPKQSNLKTSQVKIFSVTSAQPLQIFEE